MLSYSQDDNFNANAQRVYDEIKPQWSKIIGPARSKARGVRFARLVIDDAHAYVRKEGGEPACKKGCAWCCYITAMTMPVEADMIAAKLTDPVVIERVHAVAKVRENASPTDVFQSRIPCPLLDLDTLSCMVYEDRPLSCRAYNSVDATICEDNAKNPTEDRVVPSYDTPLYAASALLALILRKADNLVMEDVSVAVSNALKRKARNAR
jgi:Fe-S-cluster containining protein